MRKRLLLLIAILASFTLVAAACGDSGSSSNAGGTTTAAPATTAASTTEAPATTASSGTTAAPDSNASFNLGLTFDIGGKGDQSFNDSAAAGADKAEADFGITQTDVEPNADGSDRAQILQLQAEQSGLVLAVGFLFADDVANVAADNPDVPFAVIDDAMLNFDNNPPTPRGDNIAGLTFAEEQGSFLVGVAAALNTKSNTVGFLGGVSGFGLIEKFQAGYEAGVHAVDPSIEVVSQYITEFPDFDGFVSPDRGKEIAAAMFESGADIVYAAAGSSGGGMFQAAKEYRDANGDTVWGIGVDSDQYNTVDPSVQDTVLTSMLKRVDVAVYQATQAVLDGTFTSGNTVYDLSVDGVGYSTSGDFLAQDQIDQIEQFKAQIVDGTIVVPTVPEG